MDVNIPDSSWPCSKEYFCGDYIHVDVGIGISIRFAWTTKFNLTYALIHSGEIHGSTLQNSGVNSIGTHAKITRQTIHPWEN